MANAALFEKRLLVGFTALTLLGYLFEIIAVSTDHWLLLTMNDGMIRLYSGFWRTCNVTMTRSGDSTSEEEHCEYHNFFPTKHEIIINDAVDAQMLDYMRTGCAFSIITLILMLIGHIFAIYTIKRPRYIIKRLTALLHLMTAVSVVVLNEVFVRTVEYAEQNLPERHPDHADHFYGYSFILSWIVFVFYIAAFLVFLFLSHKRKTEMADVVDKLAEEDEPMRLGR